MRSVYGIFENGSLVCLVTSKREAGSLASRLADELPKRSFTFRALRLYKPGEFPVSSYLDLLSVAGVKPRIEDFIHSEKGDRFTCPLCFQVGYRLWAERHAEQEHFPCPLGCGKVFVQPMRHLKYCDRFTP